MKKAKHSVCILLYCNDCNVLRIGLLTKSCPVCKKSNVRILPVYVPTTEELASLHLTTMNLITTEPLKPRLDELFIKVKDKPK